MACPQLMTLPTPIPLVSVIEKHLDIFNSLFGRSAAKVHHSEQVLKTRKKIIPCYSEVIIYENHHTHRFILYLRLYFCLLPMSFSVLLNTQHYDISYMCHYSQLKNCFSLWSSNVNYILKGQALGR